MVPKARHILLTALAACVDAPTTASVSSPGMLNGMLNGFFHVEGLDAFLTDACPELHARLLGEGDLTRAFSPAFVEEIAREACDHFMFYTAELMVPFGESLVLFAGEYPVAAYAGAMGLEHVVRQLYPAYTFRDHAFRADLPIARKVVTQGYAALTNTIERVVSFKTKIAELDAHRGAEEDAWPHEFMQLVNFKPAALQRMASDPKFLAVQPDYFASCEWTRITYDSLRAPCSGDASVIVSRACEDLDQLDELGPRCSLPVVARGNLEFVEQRVPDRKCWITHEGEALPPEVITFGDVAIWPGGCPLIEYRGRLPDVTVYDDRAYNTLASGNDGCDRAGSSDYVNCDFDVLGGGRPVPDEYLDYYIYNVKPIED